MTKTARGFKIAPWDTPLRDDNHSGVLRYHLTATDKPQNNVIRIGDPCGIETHVAAVRRRVPETRCASLSDVGRPAYHRVMVNMTLLEQVERLSPSELVELRDVIQAKLDDDVPAGQWMILEQRVTEADANPDDYITLDEWKTRRRARRSA